VKKKRQGKKPAAGQNPTGEPRGQDAIEQAKSFLTMVNAGMKVADIEQKTATDQQTIRSRLQLLELTPEEQEKVAKGEILVTKGLAIVRARQTYHGRDFAPTVAQWKQIYETGKYRGEAVPEAVRAWAAAHILGIQKPETVDQIRERLAREGKPESEAKP
jgi:hypothetical protein